MKTRRRCCAPNCTNSDTNCKKGTERIALFKMPKREGRRSIWCQMLGLDYVNPYSHVCEKHFPESEIVVAANKSKRLKSRKSRPIGQGSLDFQNSLCDIKEFPLSTVINPIDVDENETNVVPEAIYIKTDPLAVPNIVDIREQFSCQWDLEEFDFSPNKLNHSTVNESVVVNNEGNLNQKRAELIASNSQKTNSNVNTLLSSVLKETSSIGSTKKITCYTCQKEFSTHILLIKHSLDHKEIKVNDLKASIISMVDQIEKLIKDNEALKKKSEISEAPTKFQVKALLKEIEFLQKKNEMNEEQVEYYRKVLLKQISNNSSKGKSNVESNENDSEEMDIGDEDRDENDKVMSENENANSQSPIENLNGNSQVGTQNSRVPQENGCILMDNPLIHKKSFSSIRRLKKSNVNSKAPKRLRKMPVKRYLCKVCNLRFKGLYDIKRHCERSKKHTYNKNSAKFFKNRTEPNKASDKPVHLSISESENKTDCKQKDENSQESNIKIEEDIDDNHNPALEVTNNETTSECREITTDNMELQSQNTFVFNEEIIKNEINEETANIDNSFQQNNVNVEKSEKRSTIYKCNFCGKEFTILPSLKRHLKMFHVCSYCSTSIADVKLFKAHLKTHSNTMKYYCGVCHERFDLLYYRNQHVKTKHFMSEDNFKCDICNEHLEYKFQLDCHVKKHFSFLRNYTCDHCGKVLTKKERLIEHISVNHMQGLYYCEICSKGFKSQSYLLEYHMPQHTGTEKFRCRICQKGFVQRHLFRQHEKRHTDNPFQCVRCDEIFPRDKELQLHIHKEHSKGKEFKCDICNKQFLQQRKLDSHMRTHTGEGPLKPFLCCFCGNCFSSQAILDKHTVTTHTFDFNYQCDFCKVYLPHKTVLERHILAHTGYKPYICQYCGKGCTEMGNLNQHIRSHTGEKPKKCNICSLGFLRNSFLKQHKEKCHPDESQ